MNFLFLELILEILYFHHNLRDEIMLIMRELAALFLIDLNLLTCFLIFGFILQFWYRKHNPAVHFDLCQCKVGPWSIAAFNSNFDVPDDRSLSYLELLPPESVFSRVTSQAEPLITIQRKYALNCEVFENGRVHLIAFDQDGVNPDLILKADDDLDGQFLVWVEVVVLIFLEDGVGRVYLVRALHDDLRPAHTASEVLRDEDRHRFLRTLHMQCEIHELAHFSKDIKIPFDQLLLENIYDYREESDEGWQVVNRLIFLRRLILRCIL